MVLLERFGGNCKHDKIGVAALVMYPGITVCCSHFGGYFFFVSFLECVCMIVCCDVVVCLLEKKLKTEMQRSTTTHHLYTGISSFFGPDSNKAGNLGRFYQGRSHSGVTSRQVQGN